MEPYDLFVAYVGWGDGGKSRPVLILRTEGEYIRVYPLTTKYKNKSDCIKRASFEIVNWQASNLSRPSYVDTGKVYRMAY